MVCSKIILKMSDTRFEKYPEFEELWKCFPFVKKLDSENDISVVIENHHCPFCYKKDMYFIYDSDMQNYICADCYYVIYLYPEDDTLFRQGW